jgi:hypothetical protein
LASLLDLRRKVAMVVVSHRIPPPFSTPSLSLSSIAALTRRFSSVQDPLLELDGSSPEPPLFRIDAELPAMTRHRSDKGRDHRDSFTTLPLIRVAANLSDEP